MTPSEREDHLRQEIEQLADKIDSPLLVSGSHVARIIRAVLDAYPASEESKIGRRTVQVQPE